MDWKERYGGSVSIEAGVSNGDVYRRFQDVDGGSNSSASNDTESTTLLDETVRKHPEPLYNFTHRSTDRHKCGGCSCFKQTLFCLIIFVIFMVVLMSNFTSGNDRGRVGTIAGWGLNTSRETMGYVLPNENTTLIEPLNVCSTTEERSGLVEENEKLFLLIAVCSSASNFEARQAIRETWGRFREFNYDLFPHLHERLRGEYLDPKDKTLEQVLKEYAWRPADGGEPPAGARTINFKVVFIVGQSEADYTQQRQRSAYAPVDTESDTRSRSATTLSQGTVASVDGRVTTGTGGPLPRASLFPSGPDVDPAFNPPSNELVDELQLRLVNESEVYGDIIQESFIDSYNNLTLKTIMMLKWITSNCDGKEPQPSDRRPNGDRKQYLQFQLDTRDSTGDIHAKLMVYVRGEEWLKNNPVRDEAAAGSASDKTERDVIFTVGKTGRSVIERVQRSIPKGAGDFLEINVTDLVVEWFKERPDPTNKTPIKYIVVETLNDLAAKLVVNNPAHSQFCDDDTFVNVPNLLHVLLGGTVPLYKAAISFYDTKTVAVKAPSNRLSVGKHLLTGFLFCEVKPIGDTSSKWYSPTYMYAKDVYPNYLSGTAYLMNLETAKLLYRESLSTPIFHLEDVYLTGIVADRAKVRRRHHPLFFYSYTKDPCALRGMISQHQLQASEIRAAYDYITNSSIVCSGPEKRLTVNQLKPAERKKCQ